MGRQPLAGWMDWIRGRGPRAPLSAREREPVETELTLGARSRKRTTGVELSWTLTDTDGVTWLEVRTPPPDGPIDDDLLRLAASSQRHRLALQTLLPLGGVATRARVTLPLGADVPSRENVHRADLAAQVAVDLHLAAQDLDAAFRARLQDAEPDLAFDVAYVAPELAATAYRRLRKLAVTGVHTPRLAEVLWVLDEAAAAVEPDAELTAALLRALAARKANHVTREVIHALGRVGTIEAIGPLGHVWNPVLRVARDQALRALTARSGGGGMLTLPNTSGALTLARTPAELTLPTPRPPESERG